jgi:hypothetical protein
MGIEWAAGSDPSVPVAARSGVPVTVLLLAGLVGTAVFVVTFVVDGRTRAGYDPRYHPVSALALGERGWVQRANFLVSGALIAASGVGLRFATGSTWLPLAVGVFGIAMVAAGLFSMDPMRGYPPGTPPGTPDEVSPEHEWHDRVSVLAFSALPAATFVAATSLEDTAWRWYSAITGVAFVAGIVVFARAWERDAPWTGLSQRIPIVLGWSWLGALCWSLLPPS